ncbi:MAG: Gfo/Idh/MocA family oxidoreductase [Erysipelotrichales bacterium]|nr:Gfo/Idh/MocA family oxidoreductase [Erysipelotrichales bacterium]
MKFMIIGLGSMGKRRLRLLKQVMPDVNIIGVDANIERRKDVEETFNVTTYSSINEAAPHVDAAFVCTSPLVHASIIKECLLHNLHVFTEINLTDDGYEENMKLAEAKNLHLFLSSTMLYRKELQYIKEHKELANNTYTYHVGQYLPDWHPWENYKNFFVNDKKSNGCRELLGIELPWIITTFGKITNMHIVKRKTTTLDIDYDDTYQLILEHENNNSGIITIDLASRKAIRTLEVIHENYHYFWQGKPNSLQEYNFETKELDTVSLYTDINKNPNYSDNIIENAYVDEILAFLNTLETNTNIHYSFKEDLYTQQIINTIEEA